MSAIADKAYTLAQLEEAEKALRRVRKAAERSLGAARGNAAVDRAMKKVSDRAREENPEIYSGAVAP
jgi:hypothetical protein